MKRFFDFYTWNDWRCGWETSWFIFEIQTDVELGTLLQIELGLFGLGVGFRWHCEDDDLA